MQTSQEYLHTVAEQYDELAYIWDIFPISAKENVAEFIQQMPQNQSSALDIGCGTGRLAIALAEYFESVIGIDISPGMIHCAKRKSLDITNTDFKVMDMCAVDFPERSFDYIVSHTTLHHLTVADQIAVLKKCKQMLRPGGKIVVIDIVAKGLMKRHAHIVRRIGALITLARALYNCQPYAFKNYVRSTHPLWMQHLQMDRFLPPEKFIITYKSIFENATFIPITREYGLNHLMIMTATK